jgi:hypothetical protein
MVPNYEFFHMNKKYQPHSAKELHPTTRPYVEWQDSQKKSTKQAQRMFFQISKLKDIH